ncbi:MAG TPA: DUF2272 domain-containing protein [Candidatus Saccharimonadales bacterium]|nr:DUF2272 domain-containing protein [Candidatus Saccharimonadales bacterium]
MSFRRTDDDAALLPELEEYFEEGPFNGVPSNAGFRSLRALPSSHDFDLDPATELELEEEVNRKSRSYVRWVQRSLNRLIAAGLSEDGISGRNTRAAVRRFQSQAGLAADGIVGPATEAALIKAGAGDPPGYGGDSKSGPVTQAYSPPPPSGGGVAEPGLEHDAATVRANAVQVALGEYQRWNPSSGKLEETSSAARPFLESYWQEGVGMSSSAAAEAIARQTAWSAAFISWVMRRAGAGSAFEYNACHANYVAAAKRNRLAGNSNPFKAYRITEIAPRPGDLVCKCRGSCETNYDTVAATSGCMPTHTDVVVETGSGRIRTIGGNLSDSVSMTSVPVDSQGRLTGHPYYAVVRVGDGAGAPASGSSASSTFAAATSQTGSVVAPGGKNAFGRYFRADATGQDDVNAYLLTYLATMIYADRGLLKLMQASAVKSMDKSAWDDVESLLKSNNNYFKSQFDRYTRDLFYDSGQPNSAANRPPEYAYFTSTSKGLPLIGKTGLEYDPEAMVIDTPKAIYVVFRGTDTPAFGSLMTKLAKSSQSLGGAADYLEWISTDFRAFFKETDVPGISGKVHDGLWNSLLKIADKLAGHIASLRSRVKKPVWITGHSLGAGQSILFSAFLIAKYGISPQGTYAIASPRPGNSEFADYVTAQMPGGRLQRFEFIDDPVPVLPPRKSEVPDELRAIRMLVPDAYPAGIRNHYGSVCEYTFGAAAERPENEVAQILLRTVNGISSGGSLTAPSPFCFHHPQWYLNGALLQVPRELRDSLPKPLDLPTTKCEACGQAEIDTAESGCQGF